MTTPPKDSNFVCVSFSLPPCPKTTIDVGSRVRREEGISLFSGVQNKPVTRWVGLWCKGLVGTSFLVGRREGTVKEFSSTNTS